MKNYLHTVRWQCPHCNTQGWSSDGRLPPHDTAHRRACRPSGQRSEAELSADYRRDMIAAGRGRLVR
jgi:hypothetical protein